MKADRGRVPEYLRHILEAISRIEQYTSDFNEVSFSENRMVQDAVIRNLEILGEASRNIWISDPDFETHYAQIPLREIYNMRNQVSHGYFSVDLDIVWTAIQNDLPKLREQIEQALQDVQG
ncbi:MAG TPA: DUF86 domain-containing protein [Silvibacterium sp.]|nr:DUF86 domain-containing protein [Silvibacterium sp.]